MQDSDGRSTIGTPGPQPDLPHALVRPEWIGPYKILSVLGEGGFGVVYLGERREPFVQRVAVKVIKPGMDSRAVIARFEQERQALALMDHPNVAKVLDGGLTDRAMPYFVMELVQGEPITAYCDRQCLTIRQRLELFVPVCEAVQHAHMRGIIHRDIKPSNVLVGAKDGIGIPKVIDFGVAKAINHTLTQKTLFTEKGNLIGTPEYMSPEQADVGSLDIDTRTDVYSLGVILYELLTGLLPFEPAELRGKGLAEIQRIIREVEPPTPSKRLTTIVADRAALIAKGRHSQPDQIVRELRRELEWIPQKAMRKERSERYRSPIELADDIRNYLANRPLQALPQTTWYRLRKFVRKHRSLVSTITLLASVLVAASLISWRYALRESMARREAEFQRESLREVNNFLNNDLLLAVNPEEGGPDTKVIDILDPAVTKLEDQFRARPEVLANLSLTLGRSYLALGDPEKAKPLLSRAASLFQSIGDSSLESEAGAALTEADYRLSSGTDQVRVAERRAADAGAKWGDDDERTLTLRNQLGGALKANRQLDEAEVVYRDVLERRTRLLGPNHVDTLIVRHNLNILSVLRARAARKVGDAEGGTRLLVTALRERQEITRDTRTALSPEHPQTLASEAELAGMLDESGHLQEALEVYPSLLDRMRRTLSFSHWRALEATARYGSALSKAGRLADASDNLLVSLEGYRIVRGELFPDTLVVTDRLADCLERTGRPERSQELLVRCFEDAKSQGNQEAMKARALKLAEFLERKGDAVGADSWRTRAK